MEENKKNEKEMEQWNDVKDKKGSGVVIVLLLLIIAGLGLFIYFNKDKLFGEKETKPEETEKQEETITFSNAELQEYVDYIVPVSIGPSAKLFNVDKVVASELSAGEKVEYIGRLVYAKHTSSADYDWDIIAESDVKNAVEKIYGPNTYKRAEFTLGCGQYTLRDDEKYYSRTGCGGTTATFVKNIVIDYTATKEKLEITTAYAFANPDGIFKDFDNGSAQNQLEEHSESNQDNMSDYLENYIKEHKNELHHIVYTFESPDEVNYYFKEFVNQK